MHTVVFFALILAPFLILAIAVCCTDGRDRGMHHGIHGR